MLSNSLTHLQTSSLEHFINEAHEDEKKKKKKKEKKRNRPLRNAQTSETQRGKLTLGM